MTARTFLLLILVCGLLSGCLGRLSPINPQTYQYQQAVLYPHKDGVFGNPVPVLVGPPAYEDYHQDRSNPKVVSIQPDKDPSRREVRTMIQADNLIQMFDPMVYGLQLGNELHLVDSQSGGFSPGTENPNWILRIARLTEPIAHEAGKEREALTEALAHYTARETVGLPRQWGYRPSKPKDFATISAELAERGEFGFILGKGVYPDEIQVHNLSRDQHSQMKLSKWPAVTRLPFANLYRFASPRFQGEDQLWVQIDCTNSNRGSSRSINAEAWPGAIGKVYRYDPRGHLKRGRQKVEWYLHCKQIAGRKPQKTDGQVFLRH